VLLTHAGQAWQIDALVKARRMTPDDRILVAAPLYHKNALVWTKVRMAAGDGSLEKLLKGQTLILSARRLSPNGFAAWAEVVHRGWEGMVAKDPTAPYVGGRTLKWLKVKVRNYRVKERGWE
jgi:hypothetical protein